MAMTAFLTPPHILYTAVFVVTIIVGKILFLSIDALTYKVVVVFICLIIISNCLAKLYASLILGEHI